MAINEVNFTIKYDGEALAQHSMDVKDLAPSLISFSDFLEEAYQNLHGGDKKLRVKFKANKEGSLGVDLQVVADLIESFTTFFNSQQISALKNFLEIVGIVGGSTAGVIQAIKKSRGRNIKRVIQREDGPDVQIEWEDGETLTVKRDVPKLLKSVSIRENLFQFTKPLSQEGYEEIKFENNNDLKSEKILSEEQHYFEVPDIAEEELLDDTRRAVFSISSLSFKEDNKWRLSDGSNIYPVKILDEEFLGRVSSNLATFSKDDVLIVMLRTRQLKTKNGLKAEYEILEVLDHQSIHPQLDFPLN
jgi:hypothetical protein